MFAAPFSRSPALRRLTSLVALACAALALNGCGGGSRVATFQPQRMVSFGDENSLIDTYTDASLLAPDGVSPGTMKGLVYTVNTMAILQYPGLRCSDTVVPTANTPYTACDTSNGFSSTLEVTDDLTQWFADPASANILAQVLHDTTQHIRRDNIFTWNCSGNVIWTQVIAHAYHLGYSNYNGTVGQCPTDTYGNAVTHAAYKARIADVINQIDSHMGELGSGTLVTIMAGQWDVLDLYNEVQVAHTRSLADAQAELKNRANNLIAAVKAITQAGGKVIVAFTPDLGESPRAYNLGDHGQGSVLYKLTYALNNQLYQLEYVPQAGRVVTDFNPVTLTDVTTRSTSYVYGAALCPLVDSNDGTATTDSTTSLKDPLGRKVLASDVGYDADAVVKYCNPNTSTLVTGGAGTYMWADAIHFAPLGHSLIGSAAYSHAYNNF